MAKAWRVYSDCLNEPCICYGETRSKLAYKLALTEKELWGVPIGKSLINMRLIRAPEHDNDNPLKKKQGIYDESPPKRPEMPPRTKT